MPIYNINASKQPTNDSTVFFYAKDCIADTSQLSSFDIINYISFLTTANNIPTTLVVNPDPDIPPIDPDDKYFNRITKGVTTDSFTIIDAGSNFKQGTFLIVRPNPRVRIHDATYVQLFLKLNSNTISSLDTFQANSLSVSTVYLLMFDYLNRKDPSDEAVVSFDVDVDNTLINPSIVQAGSFTSDGIWDVTEATPNSASNTNSFNAGDVEKIWLSSINSILVLSYNTHAKLGLTAKVKRHNTALDTIFSNPSDEADITPDLAINEFTVIITGGENYKINDTFTVSGGTQDATIVVDQITKKGGIMSTSVTAPGRGFTTPSPTVSYNGSTGSGATIKVNDNYTVTSFTINNGGNGYIDTDEICFYDPADPSEETYPLFNDYTLPLLIFTDIIGVEPTFQDAFSLDKVKVGDPGFAHNEAPLLTLVDNNGQEITNTFITSNKDNFIT